MNIKWMVGIVIFLIVALIVVELFVPKKYNEMDGTIRTFGGDDNEESASRPAEETPEN